MNTTDFDYNLPPGLIAQEPPERRTDARMMVLHRAEGRWEHRRVSELPDFLHAGDLLVMNDTKVIPARLFGIKETSGGRVELLLVEEIAPNDWISLCRTATRPKPMMVFRLASGKIRGQVLTLEPGGRIRIRLQAPRPVREILEEEGLPPLPPYIKRPDALTPDTPRDRERYQTVYARVPGAIAAPTAGLHFTPELLAEIDRRGVTRAMVTLHVGPGTFKPVKTDTIEAHTMESERYDLSAETAEAVSQAKAARRRVIAVGSTSVRTLETVASEHDGSIVAASGRSSIFIHPPYTFRVVDAMLTNFHLPKSTLIMMVSALAGREFILAAYADAIREQYRFYSYGDCMLIV